MATGSQELSCDLNEGCFPRIRTVLSGPDYGLQSVLAHRAHGEAGTQGFFTIVALLLLIP